jgi:hypothetical protein
VTNARDAAIALSPSNGRFTCVTAGFLRIGSA